MIALISHCAVCDKPIEYEYIYCGSIACHVYGSARLNVETLANDITAYRPEQTAAHVIAEGHIRLTTEVMYAVDKETP